MPEQQPEIVPPEEPHVTPPSEPRIPGGPPDEVGPPRHGQPEVGPVSPPTVPDMPRPAPVRPDIQA